MTQYMFCTSGAWLERLRLKSEPGWMEIVPLLALPMSGVIWKGGDFNIAGECWIFIFYTFSFFVGKACGFKGYDLFVLYLNYGFVKNGDNTVFCMRWTETFFFPPFSPRFTETQEIRWCIHLLRCMHYASVLQLHIYIFFFYTCGACKYRLINFQCRLRFLVQNAHNRFFQVLCVHRGHFKHPCCKILALAVWVNGKKKACVLIVCLFFPL